MIHAYVHPYITYSTRIKHKRGVPHIGSNVLTLGKRTLHVSSNAFPLGSQRRVGQQQLGATW
jgi:hypothetical protein